ncbi:hypothetical protein QYF36_005128 [Acer negundo]|nr:hypothetical protein QYF36_005128 [Acer negundo]
MLTQWIETNVKNPEARELLYNEFSLKFLWDNDEREEKCRKRGGSLGRIAFVHHAAEISTACNLLSSTVPTSTVSLQALSELSLVDLVSSRFRRLRIKKRMKVD